jgi:hypothetical protein
MVIGAGVYWVTDAIYVGKSIFLIESYRWNNGINEKL